MYHATPYCMTDRFFGSGGYFDGVGRLSDYEARQPYHSCADNPIGALEDCWERYQNLTDDHLTPDGGRSMMCGDLVMLEDATGEVTWWKVAVIGFHQIAKPAGEEA